jgi:uncharacterized protein (DUF488 family)
MARFLTLGHAARPIGAFLALLRDHGVVLVADVRTVPRSRANPQYSREVLQAALLEDGIRYAHLPALGGLRRPRPDSPNGAWKNGSFRGYTDHMQTPDFARGLEALPALAESALGPGEMCGAAPGGGAGGLVALLCAEMVPWRCHRSLVADALLARGHAVDELIGDARLRPHTLTPFARVADGRVWYPPPPG